MPFGLGLPEIAIVAIIVLLLFGPSQLPKFGRSIGQTIREFRKVGKELRNSVNDDDYDKENQ